MVFENTTKLFEKIKTIGFLGRLFSWKTIVALSMDAYSEFKNVDKQILDERAKHDEAKLKINSLTKEVDMQGKRILELKNDLKLSESKKDELLNQNKEHEKELAKIKEVEDKKQEEYEHKITEINSLKEQMDEDRKRIQQDREEEIEKRYEVMKETWQKHEEAVEQYMKNICNRHQVEYVEKSKVPFKGSPDNTVKICEEYVIFDAKSPRSDDLDNFPTYLKTQAESVKKYAKIKDVKKDIFLVVPNNTIEKINNFYYNMADYNVYIVTEDSLEPILLSLRKIEEYEFAEKLSPEERENICRVIGRFAHVTKRKIQIDTFFSNEFIGILSKCDSLPDDVLKKAIEFEKSDKLNPPMEKRAKLISKKDLKKETKKVKQMAEIENIKTDVDADIIEKIPLYKKK